MITYSTYATPRADLGEALHEFSPEGMNFIADQILVPYGVQKESGTMTVITRENMRSDDAIRAEGGTFRRIDITGEDLAYLCHNYGLEIPITDTERRRYIDDFQVELEKIAVLRLRMLLAREIRVKNKIFNTTTWTGATLTTDNSGSPWDTIGTDIISQIVAACEIVRGNTGVRPNALIIGEGAALNLIKNTGIKARFPSDVLLTIGLIRSQIGAIFGLQKLIVGDAVYNTADEGQSFSGSDIWPDDYAMVARVAEGPGSPLTTPCVGRTLRWTDMVANSEAVEQYREEQVKAEIYRAEDYIDEKVFDAYYGHLMTIDA